MTQPIQRLLAAPSILVSTVGIGGCGSAVAGDGLLERARAVCMDYRAAVAEVAVEEAQVLAR